MCLHIHRCVYTSMMDHCSLVGFLGSIAKSIRVCRY